MSVRLELSWSWQERGLLMLGRGDMKVPTRLAFPSLCSAPRACRRNESKLSDGLLVIRWTARVLSGETLSHYGSLLTLIFPIPSVLIKVHDDLEGWISLARSPRIVKQATVLLLLLLHGDAWGLPVLLHVDWLEGVAGGEVVPWYCHLSRGGGRHEPSYLRTGSPTTPPTTTREKKTTSIVSPLWLLVVTTPSDTVLSVRKINQ